jgi:hypothetical protein
VSGERACCSLDQIEVGLQICAGPLNQPKARIGARLKNGGTNLFARRARLASYSPDFKTRVPPAACRQRLKLGDAHAGPPNMLVGLGEHQKVQSASGRLSWRPLLFHEIIEQEK